MKIKLPNFINPIQIKLKQKCSKFSGGDRLWLTESTFNIQNRRDNKTAKKMFIIDDYKFINDKISTNLYQMKSEFKSNKINEISFSTRNNNNEHKPIKKRLHRSQHVKTRPVHLSANSI